jgi:hypothetical protein
MSRLPYRIDLTFERDGGCLWPGNEAAVRRFGDVTSLDRCLPLSQPLLQRLTKLKGVHDTKYDWGQKRYKPWSTDQSERFKRRVWPLLTALRGELGPEFEVVYIDQAE